MASKWHELPTELRLMIYEEYFALHRGQMHVNSTAVPTAPGTDMLPSMAFMKRQAANSVMKSFLNGATYQGTKTWDTEKRMYSSGPASFLIADTEIYYEALPLFLQYTTFRFGGPADIEVFLSQHWDYVHHVKSIIIDQTYQSGPASIEEMLQLAQHLPQLSRLCMYIDMREQSAQDWMLPEIKEVLLTPLLFPTIEATSLWILDPFIEEEYAKYVAYGRCDDLPKARQSLCNKLDEMNDRVREQVRLERGGPDSAPQRKDWRADLRLHYLGNAGKKKGKRADEDRMCFSHGVMVCPCRPVWCPDEDSVPYVYRHRR